jgi:hypothetical protein
MANEGTPSYKYVDDKVALVDNRLDKLIKVHETDLAAQKAIILKIQQHLAAFIITSTTENVLITLRSEKSPQAKTLADQLFARAGAAKLAAKKSDDPLPISSKFYDECYEDLEKLGVKIIRLS